MCTYNTIYDTGIFCGYKMSDCLGTVRMDARPDEQITDILRVVLDWW